MDRHTIASWSITRCNVTIVHAKERDELMEGVDRMLTCTNKYMANEQKQFPRENAYTGLW